MTYKPPFARMREIKENARKNFGESLPLEVPRSIPMPASVEEALEEKAVSVYHPEETSISEESMLGEHAEVVELPPPVSGEISENPSVKEEDGEEDEEDVSNPSGDFESYSRRDLNSLALTLGIVHPEKLPNKAAVVAAIKEKQQPQG